MGNLNTKKLRNVISKSANGEQFDALFGGDLARIATTDKTRQVELAVKSVINTLAFYLAGNVEDVQRVYSTSALAKIQPDVTAVIASVCSKLTTTYNKVDDLYSEYEVVTPEGDSKSKPFLQIRHVEDWLAAHGVEVRFNLMTQALEITGYKDRVLQAGGLLNTLPAVIYDDLCNFYRNITANIVLSFLRVIGEGHCYHPVIDLLNATKWDGKSRFTELYKLIGIDGDSEQNKLSQTLLTKWMRQSIAMLHNGEQGVYGAEGVLTLSGAQGIGKTTLLRCMAIDRSFFREGQRLDDRDKDTARRCITTWIAELGELDCTLKSDLGYLKAFITADIDSYRLPYGHADITMPRRASLAASVNGDSFLVDPTGNRRFWVIELEHIDVAGVQAFDFLQLWAEVNAGMNGNWQSFRLSADEQAELAERNKNCERGVKGEAELIDILATGSNYDWQTLATFKETFGVLRSYSVDVLGRALTKIGVEKKQKRVAGAKTPTRVYYLPTCIGDSNSVKNTSVASYYNTDDGDRDIPF